MLPKPELFARLAEGHAARIAVVTPNRRLAQALVSDFDSYQIKNGKSVWEAADILPFDAFVQRMYEDALYSPPAETGETGLPMLLTPAQEEQLWRQVLEKADLLVLDDAAAGCRDAWRLMHQWRVRPGKGSEDAAVFHEWSASYQRKASADIDCARLPDLLVQFLRAPGLPKTLAAYAFDILPPQTQEFFDALAARGVEVLSCRPEKKAAVLHRASFPTGKDELQKAASWARARLEANPAARIGVVVPELERRRKEVVRVFSRAMQPGGSLPGAAKAAMPFNVSLGLPLPEYSIIHSALRLLELANEEISFAEASRLIRSPFIAGAERELAERAQLDVRLRRELPATVSLAKLIGLLPSSILRDRLEKIFALREDGLFALKGPAEWARHFSALLAAAGFPGERAPDSEEFQALAKWHEALGELARLERVAAHWPFRKAVHALKKICADTLFQPESPEAPIQVLGILESAGMAFDHLWVSGLTDEAWPLKARPNPFLPVGAQVKAGIPEAAAAGSLALDRRITEGWLGAAGEVVLSFHEKDQDRSLAMSPLIAEAPAREPQIAEFQRLRDLVFQRKGISSVRDVKGPPVKNKTVRGGTRVLSDQAACPFRAFARWRLGAEPLAQPVAGLDAARRGTLVHELMKNLWSSLKDSSALERNLVSEIKNAADAAVKETGLEGRFAELERTRLARLAMEWLEVEKARPPFEVVHLEKSQTLGVAGLELSGRIDRMDRLQGGGHALIDYKTGRNPSPKHWAPPRPDDPQVPLYAVAAQEEIAAVAFAKFRPGEMRFMGFSKEKDALPKVIQSKNWQSQLQSWRDEAEALGGAFAAGEARVDPKRGLQTCRYCALQTLCRVYEKVNPLREEEAEGGDE